jgi:hypothetical protein
MNRNCPDCKGEGVTDISAEQDGSELDGCNICDGRGALGTACKCGAWTSFECTCNMWDNAELGYWEDK